MIRENSATSAEEGGFAKLVYIQIKVVIAIGDGKMGWQKNQVAKKQP
jgi:hypothetical protein